MFSPLVDFLVATLLPPHQNLRPRRTPANNMKFAAEARLSKCSYATLGVFSPAASPVEEISWAPVCLRTSLATLIWSEVLE
jgi:hypothetical protein